MVTECSCKIGVSCDATVGGEPPTQSEGPGFLPSGLGAGYRLEAGCPGSSPREREGECSKGTPAPPRFRLGSTPLKSGWMLVDSSECSPIRLGPGHLPSAGEAAGGELSLCLSQDRQGLAADQWFLA